MYVRSMLKLIRAKKQSVLMGIAFTAVLIGLADAVYLTISHYSAASVVCSLIDGCSTVLASSWAVILGIPVSALGVFYYGFLSIFLVIFYFYRNTFSHGVLLGVSSIGMFVSLWFLYLQIWEIEAICEFCILSLLSTFCIWIAAMYLKPQAVPDLPKDE